MRNYLRTAVVLGLTVGLMAFFLRNADLASVWSEIGRARPGLVAAAFLAVVLTMVVRIRRWQVLLEPLGRVGFAAAGQATIIGFAITAVLPARLGEVLRPYLLARGERLSTSATIATIVLERVTDLITVVSLLGVFLFFFIDGLIDTDEQVLAALRGGGALAALAALVALGALVFAARAPSRLGALVARALPARFGEAVRSALTNFGDGLGAAREPGRLAVVFAWSFALWLCVCASAWYVCHAFGIPLPASGSLVVMVMMVLGVAVPTPAGAGGFHAAFQLGVTSLYGAPIDAAVGAALVLHVVSFLPVALLGLVLMVRAGLTFRGAVDLASTARASGAPDTVPTGGVVATPVGDLGGR
ncbi:MAG: lysylphosphatidylglycerol synthase transmembrane domain-containing protein [Acidobacteria bacterium]|nr:lysylphosphatidylglycerol synthase transmembrane domain-containing protein [Acidobacteriota bacterium]